MRDMLPLPCSGAVWVLVMPASAALWNSSRKRALSVPSNRTRRARCLYGEPARLMNRRIDTTAKHVLNKGKAAMNWNEYREIIINTPYTEELIYAPVAVWLHMDNMPVGVISSGDTKDKIIKIPETIVNKYGKTVPVTAIGRNAFRNGNITDAASPLSVKRDGKSIAIESGAKAFLTQNTGAITDIIIPFSVTAIYQGAFADCRGLERITIPKAVKKIGQGAFGNCAALTDICYEGSPDEWKEIEIAHRKHEAELGELTPGSPVQEKVAERYIHIPGNEPVFSANIHFFCVI